MLNLAKKKFATFPNIKFELADYTKYSINGKYDAVVSFLSLMYLANDEMRKNIFKKVYNALVPEGFFISEEINVSRNKYYQEICMEKWIEHMRKSYSDEFIKTEVIE
jgi:tRNA (cmo5U34)-methyltransferase